MLPKEKLGLYQNARTLAPLTERRGGAARRAGRELSPAASAGIAAQ
jgi:hypothetical protein